MDMVHGSAAETTTKTYCEFLRDLQVQIICHRQRKPQVDNLLLIAPKTPSTR